MIALIVLRKIRSRFSDFPERNLCAHGAYAEGIAMGDHFLKDTDREVTVATYTYDALGRRIRKAVTNGGLPGDLDNVTVDYLYSGVQCVEERNGSDQAARQYVWGLYVDELIQQREVE